MKKFVLAFMFACLVAASSTAASKGVVYDFNDGEYTTGDVEYTNFPCENHWFGETANWDGQNGTCEITEATYMAAARGDSRFTAKQRSFILKMKKLSSGKRGSPVAILD